MRVEVPAAFGDALLLVSRAWFVASGFAVFVLVFVAFHRTLDRLILAPIMSLLQARNRLKMASLIPASLAVRGMNLNLWRRRSIESLNAPSGPVKICAP